MTGDEAADAAKRTLSSLLVSVGAVAFAAAVTVAPAAAKKSDGQGASTAVDANQPMTIVVSLGNQKADVYRGTTLITSTSVSTGKRGYSTKAGVFSILEKRRRHYSNLYSGAPMPWMQRLTWSGTALHAGVVPGYPASHGCIRLPYSFAPKLFSMTDVGGQVVVARSRVKPKLVEHPALLQPLPLPMPPMIVKQEDVQPAMTPRSSNAAVPATNTHLPVVFAKAEAVQPGPAATAEAQAAAPFAVHAEISAPAQRPVAVAMLEDTRTHAIDPNAVPVGSGSHAVGTKPADDKSTSAELSEDTAKYKDRLAASAGTPAPPSSPVVSIPASTVARPAVPAPDDAVVAMRVPSPQQPEELAVEEPKAGPILTVSASTLTTPAATPISVSLSIIGVNDHPPMPPEKPSVMAAKLVAGAAAAAVEAAEPRSPEPLRILITRRTNRDGLRDAQYILSSMGYLEPQKFDGTFGSLTARAIKAFQEANEMPATGAFTEDVEKKIYEVAGKAQPPHGHLFVRQKFASVFDAPVNFRNPDAPLGTHVFTVMHFESGATKAQWMAINLNEEEDPTAVLDRIEIPDDLRQNLSERLTPGSSLIVADTAINSATLPKGADFLVWDSSKPAKIERASVSPAPVKKRRTVKRRRTYPTYSRRNERRNPWPF